MKKRTIKAYAVMNQDEVVLIQNSPKIEYQVVLGMDNKGHLREELKIVPCKIIL